MRSDKSRALRRLCRITGIFASTTMRFSSAVMHRSVLLLDQIGRTAEQRSIRETARDLPLDVCDKVCGKAFDFARLNWYHLCLGRFDSSGGAGSAAISFSFLIRARPGSNLAFGNRPRAGIPKWLRPNYTEPPVQSDTRSAHSAVGLVGRRKRTS